MRPGQVLTIPSGGSAPAPAPVPVPASASPSAPAGSQPLTYTVTATDILSEIGVRFGVSWLRIAEANDIAGPNYFVRPGQVLTIP